MIRRFLQMFAEGRDARLARPAGSWHRRADTRAACPYLSDRELRQQVGMGGSPVRLGGWQRSADVIRRFRQIFADGVGSGDKQRRADTRAACPYLQARRAAAGRDPAAAGPVRVGWLATKRGRPSGSSLPLGTAMERPRP
jgi:hypothetical protein